LQRKKKPKRDKKERGNRQGSKTESHRRKNCKFSGGRRKRVAFQKKGKRWNSKKVREKSTAFPAAPFKEKKKKKNRIASAQGPRWGPFPKKKLPEAREKKKKWARKPKKLPKGPSGRKPNVFGREGKTAPPKRKKKMFPTLGPKEPPRGIGKKKGKRSTVPTPPKDGNASHGEKKIKKKKTPGLFFIKREYTPGEKKKEKNRPEANGGNPFGWEKKRGGSLECRRVQKKKTQSFLEPSYQGKLP